MSNATLLSVPARKSASDMVVQPRRLNRSTKKRKEKKEVYCYISVIAIMSQEKKLVRIIKELYDAKREPDPRH